MSKRKQSDNEDFFKKKPRAQISEVLLPENPQPQPSCATSTSCTGQRKSGIDANWKNEFPWMVTTTDSKGMLCQLCTKYQRRPKKCVPGRAVWVDVPCTSIRKSSLKNHKDSDSHKEAMAFDVAAAASKGGVAAGFVREEEINREAMIASMIVLYILCKEEIPHTTKFGPVLSVVEHIGVNVLKLLNKGGNQKYTSMRHITELVNIFSGVIWETILLDVMNSPSIRSWWTKQQMCRRPISSSSTSDI